MALVAGFPSGNGVTSHAAARRDLEGAVVRDAAGKMRAGVVYNHANPLYTKRADMRLDIPEFRAVQDKGGACFIAGEGTTTTPAFDAAPAANRRIDLLYLTQELAAIDGTTETIFGIVKGTASPTPVVPALPAAVSDAIPWASVEIPAGATSMQSAGVIVTPLYPYTAMAGGTVVVRTLVELAAWAPAAGARAYCLADTGEYVRSDGTWRPAGGGLLASGTITAQTQLYINGLTGYDRYEVTLILPTASAANDVNMRVTSGGVQDSSGNYAKQLVMGSVGATAAARQVEQTVWGSLVGAARTIKTVRATLLNLNRHEPTLAEVRASGRDAAGNTVVTETALWHLVEKAFDGVWFNVDGSGAVTGRYEVRGS